MENILNKQSVRKSGENKSKVFQKLFGIIAVSLIALFQFADSVQAMTADRVKAITNSCLASGGKTYSEAAIPGAAIGAEGYEYALQDGTANDYKNQRIASYFIGEIDGCYYRIGTPKPSMQNPNENE